MNKTDYGNVEELVQVKFKTNSKMDNFTNQHLAVVIVVQIIVMKFCKKKASLILPVNFEFD